MAADFTQALSLRSGATLKNRIALAPLTNLQSHPDGRLSDDEFKWLTMRAEGGFGLVMTCATSVSKEGVAFSGQLGVHDDAHIEGLARLASALKVQGAHAVVQLHHGGMRADRALTGLQPVAPSADAETGSRALSLDEVRRVRDDFIAAAVRAEQAGFDGVELHGAHGYILCQFLSAELNKREDEYGGSFENRARLLWEIIDGVHAECGPEFSLGVRLSPERFGMRMGEILGLAQLLLNDPRLDYLDMSLWDAFKAPSETEYKSKSLIEWFAALPRSGVCLGAAGRVASGADAKRLLEAGADFAFVGTSGILHHDFAKRVATDPAFTPIATPVPAAYLEAEGVSTPFLDYLRTRKMVA